MAILPPGVSAESFASAVREFQDAVGRDWVFTSDDDLYSYRDHFSYIKDQPNELKGRAIVKFLWWMSHEGQKYADDLLYAPLPTPVVKQIEAKIKQITYQGKPLLAAR